MRQFNLDETDDGNVWVINANSGKAMVTVVDVNPENGVIHVIDKVLLP